MTTLVFLHILGAAIWAGGLFTVAMVAVGARRTLPERERSDLFKFVGNGFLIMAAIAAMLLVLSGNLLVEDLFGGWKDLSGETGTLIAWKTVLFVAVMVLALLHGIVLGPSIRQLRMRRLEGGSTPAEESQLKTKVRISTACQVLMFAGTVAILVLAADLVS